MLMVFFSSRISLLEHVDRDFLLEQEPLATALVTSAMLRTWPVKFPAIQF